MSTRWIDKTRMRRIEGLALTRKEILALEDALGSIHPVSLEKSGGDPVLACRASPMLQCEVIHKIIASSARSGQDGEQSAWRCCKAFDELCGLSLDGGWIREEDSHWADRDPAAHALYNDMPLLAMMLIDRGASADAQLHDGEPLIVWFAKHAGSLLLDFMDRGPDLNARGRSGGTFLHHLSWFESSDERQPLTLYRLAISKAKSLRFDINVADHDGRAPLHWAAQVGDMSLAQALVEAGANPLAACANGATPWEEANGEAVANYLEAAALSAREERELKGLDRDRASLVGAATLELMRLGRVRIDGRVARNVSDLLGALTKGKSPPLKSDVSGSEVEAGKASETKGSKRL